ncbi:b(0,+)-type amino acid transporter 1 [Trichonephila clavipes]|nr:b(0,+)-type amino acid transporter 1 [Trichonephila clavipes]
MDKFCFRRKSANSGIFGMVLRVSEVGGAKRFPSSQSTGSALSELPLKMAEDGAHEDSPEEGIALKRRVGLVSGVALIVGTMIGELTYFSFNITDIVRLPNGNFI